MLETAPRQSNPPSVSTGRDHDGIRHPFVIAGSLAIAFAISAASYFPAATADVVAHLSNLVQP